MSVMLACSLSESQQSKKHPIMLVIVVIIDAWLQHGIHASESSGPSSSHHRRLVHRRYRHFGALPSEHITIGCIIGGSSGPFAGSAGSTVSAMEVTGAAPGVGEPGMTVAAAPAAAAAARVGGSITSRRCPADASLDTSNVIQHFKGCLLWQPHHFCNVSKLACVAVMLPGNNSKTSLVCSQPAI